MNDPLSPPPEDAQKRLLLTMGLLLVATLGYMYWFAPKPGADGMADGGVRVAAGQLLPDAGVTPLTAAAPGPDAGAPAAEGETAAAPPLPVVDVQRQRKEAHYTFSSRGAGLTSSVLQGAKMREQQQVTIAEGYRKLFGAHLPPSPQMNLAQPVKGEPLPLAVSIDGAAPLLPDAVYGVEEAPGADGVTFRTTSGPWEVTKVLTWPREGFELTYVVTVKNTSRQALKGEFQVHYGRAITPDFETAPSFFGGVGNLSHAACYVGDELLKLVPEKDPPEGLTGKVSYFGIDQQYFLSALYPLDQAREGRCVLTATPTARTVTAAFPLAVGPGETATFPFGGYFGPKDSDFLSVVPSQAGAGGAPAFHPPLEETVDFGIWAVICKLLLAVMKFFHGLIPNWGVAIILLTVSVKVVLLPLTHRSMVSMEAMKKLQPQMEAVRKKWANDKERQNVEMMKLYQQEKVNPLGGCLPMLIQMPVWIALFTALRNSYDLYGEPFFGPVWRDLTFKDPTYLLPLALGVTMVMTQKLQPQMMDAAQARIMTWVVPIIFTLTLLQYPAGLSLYIFTNNVLSIAQQYGLKRWLAGRNGGGGGSGGLSAVPAIAGGKRK